MYIAAVLGVRDNFSDNVTVSRGHCHVRIVANCSNTVLLRVALSLIVLILLRVALSLIVLILSRVALSLIRDKQNEE